MLSHPNNKIRTVTQCNTMPDLVLEPIQLGDTRALLRDLLIKLENKNTKVKFGSRHTKMISLYSYMLRELEINAL
jgi:hypothetical protein